MKKQFDKRSLVYVGMLIFYIWMAAQIPYTHDDWDWGLPVGWTQLITANLKRVYEMSYYVEVFIFI